MKKLSRTQKILIGVILALTSISFLYRLLVMNRLEQTSALFIGLPACLAIAFSLIPYKIIGGRAPIVGMTVKGTILFLAISGILLGEGFIWYFISFSFVSYCCCYYWFYY